jgi:hypothetical protein
MTVKAIFFLLSQTWSALFRPKTNGYSQKWTATDLTPQPCTAAISLLVIQLNVLRQIIFLEGELRVHQAKVLCGRLIMAHFERIRDVISGPFSPEIIRQRTTAGWQMVSIEWRRELPDSESPTEGAFSEDIPYGLRISDDCQRLEVEPTENQVLTLMMDLLGQDFSYSHIVSDLNEKGFQMRDGRPWNRIAVFNMMPRLIEAGPRLFSEEERKTRQKSSGL